MAGLSIHTLVRRRNQALLTRFNGDVAPPAIATRDVGGLARTFTYSGGSAEPFGTDGSIVWRFPNEDETSLWVRKGKAGYRNTFKQFIGSLYGEVDWDGFEAYNVDHLFNKARAFSADTLLRVEAVDAQVNQQHGRSFEKRLTNSSVERGNSRDMRKLTFFGALKLAGINVPTSEADHRGIQVIRDFFLTQGWSATDIDHAVSGLFDKANFRTPA